jgi:hypothetical protein
MERTAALLAAVLACTAAMAQDTKLKGRFLQALSDDEGTGQVEITFECIGAPTCVGTYALASRATGCTNTVSRSGAMSLTGVDLSVGAFSGTMTAQKAFYHDNLPPGGGVCTVKPNTDRDLVNPYTATFDGTSTGTISLPNLLIDDATNIRATFNGTFTGERAAPPPVFPMQVQATFDATANVTADIQFRPQDVGTTGSVFVFALAPAPIVKSGAQKAQSFGHVSTGNQETAVQCVLAQLSGSGQLVAVSASSMQAYVTGVLSGQGQAVTLVNGVPIANVAGATFFVGYGPNAATMLDNGINRGAATAPGQAQCKPEAPETGWWWNPAEGGRGYSIEVQGNKMFFAAFHYDVSGRSLWHVATSDGVSLEGSLYNNKPLYHVTGGQTLGGAYRAPAVVEIGKVTLAFANKRTGTMIWPGGVVPIERFNIVANGIDAAPKANQPETGWWWNPDETGRGFFMEWQNGTIDLAGYMYDDQGNPVWYLGVYETPNMRAVNGNWWSYANGQSMGGAYKPATRVSDNVAPVSITFTGPETALMTLPNGRTTALRRHRF